MGIKRRYQKIDIAMAIAIQLYTLFPWISDGTTRYTIHTYLLKCLQSGKPAWVYQSVFLDATYRMDDALKTVGGCFEVVSGLVILLQLLALIYGIVSFLGRKWSKKPLLGIMCLMIPVAMMLEAESYSGTTTAGGIDMPLVPARIFMYVLITAILAGFWFLIEKAADEWDEATAREQEEKRKKREYRKERKRSVRRGNIGRSGSEDYISQVAIPSYSTVYFGKT